MSFGLKDPTTNYLARMFDDAKYTPADLQDLKLTKYDPKDHEQDPGERKPLFHYVLRIPGFRRRAKIADALPPSPQRANQALNLPSYRACHDYPHDKPRRRKSGDLEWDMKEFARIIHNTWFLSKQQCSLVFVGVAWGTAVAVKEGGEHACCDLTKNGGTVHHERAKMWVTNTNSHLLTSVVFPVTALPPT